MKNYISNGLVSETILLLDAIAKYHCTEKHEIMDLHITYGINKQSALQFASQCKWICHDNEHLHITDNGIGILKQFNGLTINKKLWRNVLYDYIVNSIPVWSGRIPAGRKEAFIFMTLDEKRCFIESGLMDKPADKDTIDWWDTLARSLRKNHQESLDETGRTGEWLTLDFERFRTGREPEWEAIESNVVGYDIISFLNKDSSDQILIEVKSSTRDCSSAELSLTRNEWEVAQSGCNRYRYFFYLWLLHSNKQLAIISADEMVNHIPADIGVGKWKTVNIPFSVFAHKFHDINVNLNITHPLLPLY